MGCMSWSRGSPNYIITGLSQLLKISSADSLALAYFTIKSIHKSIDPNIKQHSPSEHVEHLLTMLTEQAQWAPRFYSLYNDVGRPALSSLSPFIALITVIAPFCSHSDAYALIKHWSHAPSPANGPSPYSLRASAIEAWGLHCEALSIKAQSGRRRNMWSKTASTRQA